MKSDLPPLDALVVFEAVARRLSFARAAEELFLTPSAASHQIAKLEQYLGFMLFERLSKGIVLSKAGQDYLSRVAAALAAIGSATNDIRKGVKNTLSVHASTSISSLWLMPRLAGFVHAYPEISLSLSASPYRLSVPPEPLRTSLPAPPYITSLPVCPAIQSSPSPASITSAPPPGARR